MIIKDLKFHNTSGFNLDIPLLELGNGINAIIGPNAAGKTSLLRCLAGINRFSGSVDYERRQDDPSDFISYLPQTSGYDPRLTVLEMTILGYWHSLGWRLGKNQLARVEEVLRTLNIVQLADRYYNDLSGGQKQIVNIAQTLVKDPAILLLDEPTGDLDPRNQFEIMGILKELAEKSGIKIIIVIHDLLLAARFADQITVLENGRIFASGPAKDIVNADMIQKVFGLKAHVSHAAWGMDIDIEGIYDKA